VGTETGTILPGRGRGRLFCHADMRQVYIPAWETDPSLLDVQPQGQGGRGMVAALSCGLGPLQAQQPQLKGLGWGRGERDPETLPQIPEPGKADTLWGRGERDLPSQTGDGVSVQV
jgi:hypothetical protein